MIRKSKYTAGAALGLLAAAWFGLAVPAEAGTCEPIQARGNGKNAAAATTAAQIRLTEKAAKRGGKVRNNTTSCNPIPGGFECKMTASLCP